MCIMGTVYITHMLINSVYFVFQEYCCVDCPYYTHYVLYIIFIKSEQLLSTLHTFLNPFYSHSEEWSPYLVHSASRPLNGLLYLPRVIVMMMEKFVE
jgi:hypothetical protein